MKKQALIITGAGFVIGLAEALIYYNLGKAKGGSFSYKIPPTKELLQTAGIVLVTSLLTAGMTKILVDLTDNKQEEKLT